MASKQRREYDQTTVQRTRRRYRVNHDGRVGRSYSRSIAGQLSAHIAMWFHRQGLPLRPGMEIAIPMTVKEAARQLEVTPSTIYCLCRKGMIGHMRVGPEGGRSGSNNPTLTSSEGEPGRGL